MIEYNLPEPPIQFADENEICDHNNYEEECLECKEDRDLNKYDNDRKEQHLLE